MQATSERVRTAFDEVRTYCNAVQGARSQDVTIRALQRGAWIYGAGGYGRRIARLLIERGFRCLGFIDATSSGEAVDGIPAINVSLFSPEMSNNSAFVLGIMNFRHDAKPIVDWARQQNFSDIIFPVDMSEVLGRAVDNYWMSSRDLLVSNIHRLESVALRLSDWKSIDTLAKLLRFRCSYEPQDHPDVDVDNQYYPPDLPSYEKGITFVDGGAFNGDTYRLLSARNLQIKEWIAFEPDAENIRDLSEVARQATCERISIFPCGLSSKTQDLVFQTGEGASSHEIDRSSNSGDSDRNARIRVVALDEVLPRLKCDFIKLDIEGAESSALDGMTKVISREQPRLAVSIYHRTEDLWELPEKVFQMYRPRTRFFIRQHGYNAFDTVLYALPE